MPIKRCKRSDGSLGWRWGDQGKCYPTREAAVAQAAAAYASGYREAANFEAGMGAADFLTMEGYHMKPDEAWDWYHEAFLLEKALTFVLNEASMVQSILFHKSKFNIEQARKWLKDHGFIAAGVDDEGEYYRFRQRAPGKFKRFRMHVLRAGIKAVLGFDK